MLGADGKGRRVRSVLLKPAQIQEMIVKQAEAIEKFKDLMT